MLSKNEIKGKGKQIEGAIKAKVGAVLNNPRLEAEGKAERLEGQVQEKIGKGRRKVGEVVAKAGNAIAGKR